MKNRKRLILYSVLLLPFILFAAFSLTLDPIGRASFFRELKTRTAAQFGFEEELAAPDPIDETDAPGAAAGGGGGGGGGFDPARIFARRDADEDGKLTRDEAGERMRDNFDQIDTDGDGAITLEEMEAGMAQMRANRGGGGSSAGGDGSGDAPDGSGDAPDGSGDAP